MITAAVRRAALATFPHGTPLVVVAPEAAAFADIVAERNDAAVAYCALLAEMQLPEHPYVLLEGVDDADDPAALLRALRRALPRTRLFVLLANGGHLTGLGAFFSGRPLGRAHPYTHADVAALFAASGWASLGVAPLADDALPLAEAAPLAIVVGAITFNCFDAATLERGRIAAFLAIADPE